MSDILDEEGLVSLSLVLDLERFSLIAHEMKEIDREGSEKASRFQMIEGREEEAKSEMKTKWYSFLRYC